MKLRIKLTDLVTYFPEIITVLLTCILIIFVQFISFDEIVLVINNSGFIAPVMYIFIHIVGGIFAPLGMSPLFIAGWYIFGPTLFIYEFISTTLISIINFYISKKFGIKVLKRFVGTRGVNKILSYSQHMDSSLLYLIRFLTFSTNDYASYAFGLTKISTVNFIISSMISNLIWCLLWRYIFIYTLGSVYMFFFWFAIGSIPLLIIFKYVKNNGGN